MRIEYRRDPLKALRAMPRAKVEDIFAALDRIAANPFARNNNLKPLKGVVNGYRLRVGDWRVSYTLDRAEEVMIVFEAAPRGGAYR
jgi:mRNA interferase RelE/StbE